MNTVWLSIQLLVRFHCHETSSPALMERQEAGNFIWNVNGWWDVLVPQTYGDVCTCQVGVIALAWMSTSSFQMVEEVWGRHVRLVYNNTSNNIHNDKPCAKNEESFNYTRPTIPCRRSPYLFPLQWKKHNKNQALIHKLVLNNLVHT